MIEIKLADNNFKTEHNIKHDAYICTDKGEVLGLVCFEMQKDKLFLESVTATENMLLDGLVRQTMSYALDNDCKECIYTDEVQKALYSVRIIKKERQKSIDILDFFMQINHL